MATTRYPAGVPCWVELCAHDMRRALDFYAGVFGWGFSEQRLGSSDAPRSSFVALVDGMEVAGISAGPVSTTSASNEWFTHVAVDAADASTRQAERLGGDVLEGPSDLLPAGRQALLADPTGARFALWEAGTRGGAQLVNESQSWALSLLRT